jgi:hypothetical protein
LSMEYETDIADLRASLAWARKLANVETKADKDLRKSKKKKDKYVTNEIEQNIFASKYRINSGAYHGGSFNGVHCRFLMTSAAPIFDDIKAYLLSVDHEAKLANDTEIKMNCDAMKRLQEQLGIAFSILRMPYGTPKEEDFTNLQVALDHVKRLWTIDLGLSHTPKFHVLITHALRQMRRIDGFGCMLEDHVEKSHQEGGKHDQRRALQASLIARRQQMIQRSLLLRKKQLKGIRASVNPPVLVWLQEIKLRRSSPETFDAQKISLPSRCDHPVRKFSHMRRQSRNSRITVLKFNSFVACSSCYRVQRVRLT